MSTATRTKTFAALAAVALAAAAFAGCSPEAPEPAGTGLTRRRFLSRSAGMALAV